MNFFPQITQSNFITSGSNEKKAKKSTGCLARLSYWHQNGNEFPTNIALVQQYVHKLTLLSQQIEVLS